MKKLRKLLARIVSVAITVAMAITMLPTTLVAAADVKDNGYTFAEATGELTVTTDAGTTAWRTDTAIGKDKVTKVVIGSGVQSIGGYAFHSCTSLTSVTIPDSVQSIGDLAFFNCTSLTSVTIPDSVTSIVGGVFNACTSLTSVTLSENMTSIGSGMFAGCISLTSVTIPNSVKDIGDSAFSGCTSLSSVTIPDSVTSIGNSVFETCTSLTSVTLSENMTSIGNGMFANCTSLTSVTIPDSVTSIGYSVFYKCTSLTSVTIPNGVKGIGNEAFSGCTSLTSVTIPNGVKEIGNETFLGCTSLTSVTIPNGVKGIYARAFASCASLTSMTIPDSVISIGDEAFFGCSQLKSVIMESETPCNLGADVFKDTAADLTIQVPEKAVDNYKNASAEKSKWANYKDYIVEVNVDPEPQGTATVVVTIENDSENKAANATVTLSQKGKIVRRNSVSKDGTYTFSGLKAGIYEVTAEQSGHKSNGMVVAKENLSSPITLLLTNGNTLVAENFGSAPYVSNAWGLEQLYLGERASESDQGITEEDMEIIQAGGTATLKLTATDSKTNRSDYFVQKDVELLTNEVGAYKVLMDVRVVKAVTDKSGKSQPEVTLTELAAPVTFSIDLSKVDLAGKRADQLCLYRLHGEVVEEITSKSMDEEVISVNGNILTVTVKNFSLYMLATIPSPSNGVRHHFSNSAGYAKYWITAEAGEGGTISPKGETKYDFGTDAVYTVTPNAGYEVDKVVIDGTKEVTLMNGSYTFKSIDEPYTIRATFKKKGAVPTDSVNRPTILPAVVNPATGDSIFSHLFDFLF